MIDQRQEEECSRRVMASVLGVIEEACLRSPIEGPFVTHDMEGAMVAIPWDAPSVRRMVSIIKIEARKRYGEARAWEPKRMQELEAQVYRLIRDREVVPADWPAWEIRSLAVLEEVFAERKRQRQKWGLQTLPNGTGSPLFKSMAAHAKQLCQAAARAETLTWMDIANEEFLEAMAEEDPQKLRTELLQLAAVAVQWAEALP